MYLAGVDYINSLMKQETFTAKMVFNGSGAIIFPVRQEHRDYKADCISYEDNYGGNALAAVLDRGKIEVHYHKKFSDELVSHIMRTLVSQPDLEFMKTWDVFYQGRKLAL